ncbi:uncharacterized protein LOC144582857 [Callithrix jacchus]
MNVPVRCIASMGSVPETQATIQDKRQITSGAHPRPEPILPCMELENVALLSHKTNTTYTSITFHSTQDLAGSRAVESAFQLCIECKYFISPPGLCSGYPLCLGGLLGESQLRTLHLGICSDVLLQHREFEVFIKFSLSIVFMHYALDLHLKIRHPVYHMDFLLWLLLEV